MAIEGTDVPALLAALDARGREDAAACAAAKVIRALEIQVASQDAEIIEAEWRALAHSVEIARMSDIRNAFWERRSAAKAGRR